MVNPRLTKLIELMELMKKTIGFGRSMSNYTKEEKKKFTFENLRKFLIENLYSIMMDKTIKMDDSLIILLLCGCKEYIYEDLMKIENIKYIETINEDPSITMIKSNFNELIRKDFKEDDDDFNFLKKHIIHLIQKMKELRNKNTKEDFYISIINDLDIIMEKLKKLKEGNVNKKDPSYIEINRSFNSIIKKLNKLKKKNVKEDNFIDFKEDINITIEKLKNIEFFKDSYTYQYLIQRFVVKAINDNNRELLWALIFLNYRIINNKVKEILIKNNVPLSFCTLDQCLTSDTFLLHILLSNEMMIKNIKIIKKLLEKFDSNNTCHQYQVLKCCKYFDFKKIKYENKNLKKFIEIENKIPINIKKNIQKNIPETTEQNKKKSPSILIKENKKFYIIAICITMILISFI